MDNLQYGRGEKTNSAIYESKLFPQIKKINPYLTDNAIMQGINELLASKDETEVFKYLCSGIKVISQGENKHVQFIDFSPANISKNKFSYFRELPIRNQYNTCFRPDLILFINYLPVVVFEFKDQFQAGLN